MAELDPQVAKVLAKMAASADAARARQGMAAAAARAKIAQVGRSAQDYDSATGLDVPETPSAEPYDFEKALERYSPESGGEFTPKGTRILKNDHGFPSEADVHPEGAHSGTAPEGGPRSLAEKAGRSLRDMNEMPTEPEMPEGLRGVDPNSKMSQRMNQMAEDNKIEVERHRVGEARRSASSAHPEAEFNPTKSVEQLAQEDAERILGRKPLAPPEVGAMEGQPVTPKTIKVPDAIAPEVPELSDSQVKSLVEELQGGSEGKILSTAEDAAQLQSATPKAAPVVEDAMQSVIKRSVPSGSRRFAGRLAANAAREAYEAPSLAARAKGAYGAARKLAGGAVGAAKSTGRAVLEHPVTRFAAGDVIDVLKPAAQASKFGLVGRAANVGIAGAKMAAKDMVVPWIAQKIAEGGTRNMFENLSGGGAETWGGLSESSPYRGVEMPNAETGDPGFSSLLDASQDAKENLANYNASANKYGLKVTGRTGMGSIYGLPLINRVMQPGPDIQVEEDAGLKAAYQARNKQRIQEMMENWATNPDQ